jgi:hypothetical protein
MFLSWDQPWTTVLLPTPPCSWDHRHVLAYPACWLRWSLPKFLPELASNCDPLNRHLSSSWNYRPVPLAQFFVVVVQIGSRANFCLSLLWTLWSSYLCFLSCWDHRYVPLHLAYFWDRAILTFAWVGLKPGPPVSAPESLASDFASFLKS